MSWWHENNRNTKQQCISVTKQVKKQRTSQLETFWWKDLSYRALQWTLFMTCAQVWAPRVQELIHGQGSVLQSTYQVLSLLHSADVIAFKLLPLNRRHEMRWWLNNSRLQEDGNFRITVWHHRPESCRGAATLIQAKRAARLAGKVV